jgi:hypothetical protein
MEYSAALLVLMFPSVALAEDPYALCMRHELVSAHSSMRGRGPRFEAPFEAICEPVRQAHEVAAQTAAKSAQDAADIAALKAATTSESSK